MTHKNERTITIPYPRATQNVNRGYLVDVPKMEVRCIRITRDDRAFIDKVANKMNMTFSEFVRWASYYSALAVSKEQKLEDFEDKRGLSKSLADQGFK